MKITTIIVTYGNRFHLLEQVLLSCINEKINTIVVVNNNASEKSRCKLAEFNNSKKQLYIVDNLENLGSAKAYKQGLQYAKNLSNDFILLLDDDNKLEGGTIELLKHHWQERPTKVEAFLCFRPDRNQFKEAIQTKNPDYVLGSKNSFSGFHIQEKVKNIFGVKPKNNTAINKGIVSCAPYGGLFFKKELLDKIGYPTEDYFLYVDDHDWTYNITKRGFKIQLLLDAKISDIDTSWAINKSASYFKNIRNAPHFRVYYSIRNRKIFEEENLVSRPFVYKINQFFFTFFMFLYAYNHNVFKVYLRAIKDAKNRNLVRF